MVKFKIGDIVKIKDAGECYTSYTEWARKHNLLNYKENKIPLKGSIGKVVAVGKHSTKYSDIICGVNIDGIDFMIGEDGLKLINRRNKIKILW